MIALRRIRAVNYRCLRDVDVELDEFHVLVGANGSGKSALFDALLFVRDSLLLGLDKTAEQRTGDFRDLVWGRPDRDLAFQLAFEIDVPNTLRDEIPRSYGRFAVSLTVQEAEGGNLNGTLVGCLKPKADSGEEPPTDGTFNPGTWKTDMRFDSATLLGPTIEFEHPLVTRLVMETFFSVHELALDNRLLRQASKPPTLGRPTPIGDLPSLFGLLKRHHPDRYDAWLKHIRTAITDLRDIDVRTREDDRHSYLVATLGGGLRVPLGGSRTARCGCWR